MKRLALVLLAAGLLAPQADAARYAVGVRTLAALPALRAALPDGESLVKYIWPLVFGTLLSATIAIVIAVPMAIAVALFTSHLAPRRLSMSVSYLPDLLAGRSLLALAMSEPDAGSAATELRTSATPDGDDYLINGSKVFSTNSPDATAFLVKRWSDRISKPRVLVNASAIGIYGNRGDEVLTEESVPGGGFLADLCRAWEEAALRAREAGASDAADGLERYAARCFDCELMAFRVVQRYRGSHVGQAEFVEHDDVRACAQRLLKLLHRFHFHFDFA